MGWEARPKPTFHLSSCSSISGTRCTARASCKLPNSTRNPSLANRPPPPLQPANPPSATIGASRDIGGLWLGAAEGRLDDEGCSVRTGREVGASLKVGDEPGIGMIWRL